jgi:hypothetical protein
MANIVNPKLGKERLGEVERGVKQQHDLPPPRLDARAKNLGDSFIPVGLLDMDTPVGQGLFLAPPGEDEFFARTNSFLQRTWADETDVEVGPGQDI